MVNKDEYRPNTVFFCISHSMVNMKIFIIIIIVIITTIMMIRLSSAVHQLTRHHAVLVSRDASGTLSNALTAHLSAVCTTLRLVHCYQKTIIRIFWFHLLVVLWVLLWDDCREGRGKIIITVLCYIVYQYHICSIRRSSSYNKDVMGFFMDFFAHQSTWSSVSPVLKILPREQVRPHTTCWLVYICSCVGWSVVSAPSDPANHPL